MHIYECIKYSYYDGSPKKVRLVITDNMIIYRNMQGCFNFSCKNKVIPYKQILGVMFGPKTTVFSMVNKNRPPWNMISIIIRERTFDFEFEDYTELKDFIKIMYGFRRKNSLNFVLPYVSDINKDIVWMNNNMRRLERSNILTLVDWYKTKNNKYAIFKNQDDNKECIICLEKFKLDEQICKLNCKHFFHIDCIELWINKKNDCPLCRTPLNHENIEEDNEELLISNEMSEQQYEI